MVGATPIAKKNLGHQGGGGGAFMLSNSKFSIGPIFQLSISPSQSLS